MTLRITGKHMEVGDAFRGRIEDRIGESVSKYFDGGFSGRVIMTKEGSRISADCMVSLDTGASFQTAGEAQDPNVAFELAAERLDKRLRRYKRKLKSHYGNGTAVKAEEAAYRILSAPDDEGDEAGPDGDAGPAIVSEHAFQLGTMTVATAAAALDAKADPFFVFRNASNGQVNVVYHRPDGNIGWIDPANGLA